MQEILKVIHDTIYQFFDVCEDDVPMSDKDKLLLEVNKAICNNLKALEQIEPKECGDCCDCVDRNTLLSKATVLSDIDSDMNIVNHEVVYVKDIKELPSVEPERKTGKCKGCKYFEYDSMAKVDGIPPIVAHEICKRWGDGCKTSEDGYCFLYEPQEMEVEI